MNAISIDDENFLDAFVLSELFEFHNKRQPSELKPLSLNMFYTSFMLIATLLLISILIFLKEIIKF